MAVLALRTDTRRRVDEGLAPAGAVSACNFAAPLVLKSERLKGTHESRGFAAGLPIGGRHVSSCAAHNNNTSGPRALPIAHVCASIG